MGTVVLYNPEDEDDKEPIEAELSAGYDVMFDNISERYESEEEALSDMCRLVEVTIFQQIQESSNGPELHNMTAEILRGLDDRGAVDINKLVEQSIHQLTQLSDE